MTKKLQQIITKLSKLNESDQNRIADLLSQELGWDDSFKSTQPQLQNLANEALGEYETGNTKPLKL